MQKTKKASPIVSLNQRTGKERRGTTRREKTVPAAVERRVETQPRREKVNRRRQIDPTTCERDYTDDEVEFMHALDRYKRASGRMFPTCSEVLEVLRDLGYRKTAPMAGIALEGAQSPADHASANLSAGKAAGRSIADASSLSEADLDDEE